ncbi:MAG: M12 family metallo-peptidase [Bacteroidota bacterium]
MNRLSSLTLLAIFLAFFFPQHAFAQLIGDPVDPNDYDIDVSADDSRADILRKRYVQLSSWDFNSRLSLELFPDLTVEAYNTTLDLGDSRKVWEGGIQGSEGAYVILSERDGVFFGKIVTPDYRTYQLIHKGSSVYAIYEVDGANLAVNENDQVQEEQGDVVPQNDPTICDQNYVCASSNIDILIVYTPAAKAEMGSAAAIEAAIAAAITEMNTVNTNSGVSHTYTLVHTAEVNYTESGSSSTDLSALRSQTDGIMDNAHTLRYIYRADLVGLITSSSYCGLGYVPLSNTFFSASSGFSLTGVNCMNTNLTLAHECGHNMGLHHDYFVNSDTRPCAHNHGYVNQAANGGTRSQRWRTVMAYNNQCSNQFGFNCSRIPYWSNPNLNYTANPMGVAIGNTEPSDNAFALNRSSCLVAGMSDQLVPFPVEYQAWEVEVEGQNLLLNWATALELNNMGFEIEMRTVDAEEFRKVGFVAGNGSTNETQFYSFQINRVFPGRHIVRLKQIDQDGSFSYSSLKEVEIEKREQLYHRVYPNPGQSLSQLEIVVYRTSEYSIDVMDMNGKLVREVFSGELNAGPHSFDLDLSDFQAGLYFYSVRSLIDQEMGKMWVKQ